MKNSIIKKELYTNLEGIPAGDYSYRDTDSMSISQREIIIREYHECEGMVGETNEWFEYYSVDLFGMEKRQIDWQIAKDIYNACRASGASAAWKKEFWIFIREMHPKRIKERDQATMDEIESIIY